MKILFDHQIFSLQARGGISRYFTQLAKSLANLKEEVEIIAPLHQNKHLAESACGWVRGNHINLKNKHIPQLAEPLNHWICNRWIQKMKPDVIHETYYTHRSVGSRAIPHVVTIHDMIQEKFHTEFSRRDRALNYKRASVAKADHVICVSESTKTDLCNLFGTKPEKISVIYHGHENNLSDTIYPPPQARPYLLYVGNRGGYKNFRGMLAAIASQPVLQQNFDIIAFGGGPFQKSERDLIQHLRLDGGSVRQIQGNDMLLAQLYQNATALVYPSLYEGFGLPPLEAMGHGCPVISSFTSSMPEVIGDAGEYFDPTSIDSQVAAIENVALDKKRQATLVQKGRQRVLKFSWENCAQNTLSAYRAAQSS